MQKDNNWFAQIKWSQTCIECQKKHNGICHNRSCAEDNYDPWGDELPAYLWYADGNDVEKYLSRKRAKIESQTLSVVLEQNYTLNAGLINKNQMEATIFNQWIKLVSDIYKICVTIYKNNEWTNLTELSQLPEHTELFDLIHQAYTLIGNVNGYPLLKEHDLGKLLVSYARSLAQQKCAERPVLFRDLFEKYIARQIIVQKLKPAQIIEAEYQDIQHVRKLRKWRKNQMKRQEEQVNTNPHHISFTTIVVLCNTFYCNKNHPVEDVQALLNVVDALGNIHCIQVPAGYCKACNIYFLLESDFRVAKSQGVLLCQLISKEKYASGLNSTEEVMLKPESLLHQSGYNVNALDGLTSMQRQLILSYVLDNKLYTVNGLLSFLDWLINRNNRVTSKNMSSALQKWREDRKFVANYDLEKQRQVYVGTITK